jgi:hypothetical protein
VRLEGIGNLKKFSDLTGNGTRNLSACSIVPQLTTLPCAPYNNIVHYNNVIIAFSMD